MLLTRKQAMQQKKRAEATPPTFVSNIIQFEQSFFLKNREMMLLIPVL